MSQSREPATASVVVRLRPGRSMQQSDVASVVHLVASGVPGLSESRVSVVSADGTTLHRPNGDGEAASNDARSEREHEMQSTLEARARELLERTVGRGHADVRVSVELDQSSHERTEEHYEPQRSVLRSEQRMEERNGPPGTAPSPTGAASVAFVPTAPPPGAAAPSSSAAPSPSARVAAGVPGSQTNLPGGVSPEGAGGAIGPGPYKQSYTRNFEVDRVTEKTVQVSGKVVRISVAVLVDGVKKDGVVVPREKEEMERLSELVKSAVGFNAARGDALHIESSAFSTQETEEPVAVAAPLLSPRMMKVRTYAPIAGVVVALVVIALVVRRSRKKKAQVAAAGDIVAPEPPIFQLENSTMTPAKALPPGDIDALRKEALDIAVKDPATAANVLRSWLHAQSVA